MKKILLLAIIPSLIASQAFALANDFRYMRRDPTNITNLTLDIPTPATTSLMTVDITAGVASVKHTALGVGLSYNGTTLSVNSVPVANITGLATVATSGSYSDLSGKPSIPSAQIQADWTQASTGALDYVKNKPSFSTVAATGAYSDLSGTPSLAAVAFSGDYTDLTSKPSIPAAQVKSDWSSSSGLSEILNKPSLSTVATSGAYADLTGKPSIPSAQVQTDWNQVTSGSIDFIKNKPSLATVATTGAYSDLSGKPTIPAAQVNSDWSAVSGSAQILNKPTLSTVATTGSYSDLSGKPSLATVATSGDYNDLSSKPSIPATVSGSNVTRTPGTCFQVSSTRNAMVSYSVDVTTALSLTSGAVGKVAINTYTNSSCTTGSTEIDSQQAGLTGALVIGLGVNNPATVKVNGWVASGLWVNIVDTSTTGTATFAYRKGTEVLF